MGRFAQRQVMRNDVIERDLSLLQERNELVDGPVEYESFHLYLINALRSSGAWFFLRLEAAPFSLRRTL